MRPVLALLGVAQRRVEARGVHAAVPAQHPLGRHPERGQRLVGGGAGGEDDVARAVEGADGQRHRVGDALLAGAQARVGGQLGVVAADQRQRRARARRARRRCPPAPASRRGSGRSPPSAASVCTAAGRLGTPIRRPG